jgi:hypothetical protein
MASLNLYIGNLEGDLSNNYLCLDITFSDETEVSLEQSDSLESLSELDFIQILEEYCNRANYVSMELNIPIKPDIESLIMACQDDFSEDSIKSVKSLLRELRQIKK